MMVFVKVMFIFSSLLGNCILDLIFEDFVRFLKK